MGLRHLCVVPPQNDIVGILTRKDILAHVAELRLHDKLACSTLAGSLRQSGLSTSALAASVPQTPALSMTPALRRARLGGDVAMSQLGSTKEEAENPRKSDEGPPGNQDPLGRL